MINVFVDSVKIMVKFIHFDNHPHDILSKPRLLQFLLLLDKRLCTHDKGLFRNCKNHGEILSMSRITKIHILSGRQLSLNIKISRFRDPDRWFCDCQSHSDLLTKCRSPIAIRSRKKRAPITHALVKSVYFAKHANVPWINDGFQQFFLLFKMVVIWGRLWVRYIGP